MVKESVYKNWTNWNYDDIVSYIEPWYGPEDLEVHVEIHMTVQHAINLVKNAHKGHELTGKLTDQELLEDFMVCHWAQFVGKD